MTLRINDAVERVAERRAPHGGVEAVGKVISCYNNAMQRL